MYTLADAFWLYHVGTQSEADEYNLCKAELHPRNVVATDPFPLLWFGWLSFFTGLSFSCWHFITVMYLLAYPPKTLPQMI